MKIWQIASALALGMTAHAYAQAWQKQGPDTIWANHSFGIPGHFAPADANGNLQPPSGTVRGGTLSATAPANEFQTGVSTAGTPQFAQPSFGNLSGSAAPSQLPGATTNAQGAVMFGTSSGTAFDGAAGAAAAALANGAVQASGGASGATITMGRTLAARAQDVVNVKDAPYNAKGDTQKILGPAAIAANSESLTVSNANFTASDVGKKIAVPNAGATPATGLISAISMASPGAGYTSAPTASFSGAYTNSATPGILMGVVSASVSGAGTCAGLATTVTGTLAATGTPPVSPATFSLTTNGTSITGVSAVLTPGNWWNAFPGSLSAVPLKITGCSGAPTLNISMGVVGVGFGNLYYGTGYGSGYPLTGVTMSLSGGGFTTPAVVGSVTVTPQIPPLETTIASVQGPTQVTLSAPAQTAVNQSETVTYGTDDTASIQAALNSGKPDIYFPQSSGDYWAGELYVPSFRHLYGKGTLAVDPLTTSPLLRLSDNTGTIPSTNVEMNGMTLVGNRDSSINRNSGSNLVSGIVGNAHIYLHDLTLGGALPTAIAFDGAYDLKISHNTIDGSYYGAGIQMATTTPSTGAIVDGNYITDTQLAPISTYYGLTQSQITNNYLLGSNLGYGDSSATGLIEDCITGYSANASNQQTIISHNEAISCGNNGIHWGGDHLIISDNQIYAPVLYGILVARKPSTDPTLESDITIIGNHFYGADNQHSNQGAISVRNMINCVITGNEIDTDYIGIELYATADSSGGRDCNVVGNQVNNTIFAIWLRKKAQYNQVSANDISNSNIGIAASNSALSIDTTGSFPSFHNTVGTNMFDSVSVPIEETQTTDYNSWDHQSIQNGAWSLPVMTGTNSRWAPPLGVGDTAVGLTAGTSSSPYPIAFSASVFTTVASGGAAIVDGHMSGQGVVVNRGANALSLEPPTGGSWNGGSADVAVSIPVNGTLSWFCASPSACFSR